MASVNKKIISVKGLNLRIFTETPLFDTGTKLSFIILAIKKNNALQHSKKKIDGTWIFSKII